MPLEQRKELNGTRLGRVAFVPSLRKCGSTEMAKFFKHVERTTKHLARDRVQHPAAWTDEQIARHFFQFTIVRDPLSHFLAGAHQLSVFVHMNWIRKMDAQYGINFQNRTCFDTDFGTMLPCDPPYARPLDLLEAILDDVDRIGFFDEHIFPITYQIAMSKGMLNLENYYILDIRNISALENELNIWAYDEAPARYVAGRRPMSRKKTSKSMPWVIMSKDLLALAEHDCRARNIVQRFCRLYAEDYTCLPYELPCVCLLSH